MATEKSLLYQNAYAQGFKHVEQENYAAAEPSLLAAINLNPDSIEAFTLLAKVYEKCNQLEKSALCLRAALMIEDHQSKTWFDLGNCYYNIGRHGDAIAAYQKTITQTPEFVPAYTALGLTYLEIDRTEEALDILNQAVSLDSENATVYLNRSAVYIRMGLYEKAKADIQHALALEFTLAGAWGNLALIAEQYEHDTQASLAYYETAIQLSSNPATAYWHRCQVYLRAGMFVEGWQEYHWRWKTHRITKPSFPKPEWEGQTLTGKTLMVCADGGYGDIIQYARLIPLLQIQCQKLIIFCRSPLKTLLQQSFETAAVFSDNAPLPPYDMYVCITDLPQRFQLTFDTMGMQKPYIIAERQRIDSWQKKLSAYVHLKIGLVWSGSSMTLSGRNRSCDFQHFLPLFSHPETSFFGIQHGPEASACHNACSETAVFHNLEESLSDFHEVAAIIANLDLVITIDTAIAHLAGAMGKPVWVMLPYAGDWRWFYNRQDSPWYPSMRLFRQPTPGNWPAVIEAIQIALKRFRVSPP